MRKLLDLICPSCGRAFRRFRSQAVGQTICCSRSCARRARPSRITLLSFTCQRCGKPFQRRKGYGGKHLYCSIACGTLASTPKGSAHPNWKGGVSERAHVVRCAIAKRVRGVGACERCGATDNLHGHHILPHSTHPGSRADPSNIQVLCANCHAGEHPEMANVIAMPRRRSGIEIACAACGKRRYVMPSLVTTAKFCSHACQLARLHGVA